MVIGLSFVRSYDSSGRFRHKNLRFAKHWGADLEILIITSFG